MNSLRIEWEWEAAPTIRAPELRATFARLRINVGADCLTLVEDQESGSSRRAIAVSLYSLAEWVAYNWWFLLAESRHSADPRFAASWIDSSVDVKSYQRHNIRNAGDGFLWPNLFVLPEGDRTSLLWRADRSVSPRWPVRFLQSGQSFVDSSSLQRVLGNFVQAVLDRLADCEVGSTRLREEWDAIQSADVEETEYLLASARLGLDPYSEAVQYENDIIDVSRNLDGDLLREFLNVADPRFIADDLRWVLAARSEIENITSPRSEFDEAFIEQVAGGVSRTLTGSPWRAGYRAARAVRNGLRIGVQDPFDIESYISDTVLNSPDRSMQAYGTFSSAGPALVLGSQLSNRSRRFTMARAAWNLLQRSAEPFLVTAGHTAQQKAERAFAAELLVPAEGLASYLDSDIDSITDDDIDRAGEHFGVSPLVVKHQMDNQLTLTSDLT